MFECKMRDPEGTTVTHHMQDNTIFVTAKDFFELNTKDQWIIEVNTQSETTGTHALLDQASIEDIIWHILRERGKNPAFVKHFIIKYMVNNAPALNQAAIEGCMFAMECWFPKVVQHIVCPPSKPIS